MRESGQTISEIEFPSNVIPLRVRQPLSEDVGSLKHRKGVETVDRTQEIAEQGYTDALRPDFCEWTHLLEVIGEAMSGAPVGSIGPGRAP